jgi:hypothetical protein
MHGICQCRKTGIRQAAAAVEDLAHEVIERLGYADAVPRFGHLRAAAQGVDGAIYGLRQIMGCGLAHALAQIVADFGQMTRCFLAEDFVQLRIHGGRLRRDGVYA